MASMVHGTTSDSSSPAPASPAYRALPSLDRLLGAAPALVDHHGRVEVTQVLRETLADARQAIGLGQPAPSSAALLASAEARLAARAAPRLKPVFNLSGTVLHTNLGRAVLPEEAIAAMVEASTRLMVPLEVTTTTRDVLAVALPPGLDRNGDGYADADNNKNGVVDDDLPADETNDGGAGIIGIDDDGNGLVDYGVSVADNDENGTIGSAPVAPRTGADWIDPVVYYRVGTQLVERLPNIAPFNGNDFTVRPIADNVTAFSVTRVATGNRRYREVLVQLTLTGPGGETGSWSRRRHRVKHGGCKPWPSCRRPTTMPQARISTWA